MIPEPSATAATSKNSQDDANCSGAVNHSEDESGNENRQKNVVGVRSIRSYSVTAYPVQSGRVSRLAIPADTGWKMDTHTTIHQRRKKREHQLSKNVKSKSAKTSPGTVRRTRSSSLKQKHVEAVTLFEVLTMGKSAMQMVIAGWVDAYVKNRDSSLLDLISFFIQCCGCKGVVTAEMCQNKEDSDVMSKMVEKQDEATGLQYKKFLAFPWILTVTWPVDSDNMEYPLIQSGPYGRWFHSEFCDFVSVLVAQCRHSVIFDSYLMNSLISLLTELSNSYIRAFRHTCTLAAVKLLSSLVGVAQSLSVSVENTQKLYVVQKTRTLRQKSSQQQTRIQKKITELQEKRTEVESMMDIIFKGVFLKRHRDVFPEIRCVCMEELGLWMKLYSSAFLNDSCLKYLGWMMNDKVPDVRLKCVLGLHGLYGDPQLLPKLDLFTSRFKDRMISMTRDKDNEVAVQTMKLLVLISKAPDDVLRPEDYQQLLQLVYSSQRPLAVTAGELLFSRFIGTVAPASDTPGEMSEEETHGQQTLSRLKALLRFYQESELHQHVVYLVDSLWDCAGALLKDWPAFASVLLQDPSSHAAGLTQAEQAVIVEILVASVRQASEGPALAGRTGAKKVLSVREKKVLSDDCRELTEHLLVLLPRLLSKFSGSADVVTSLMKIPQYFQTDCPADENKQALSSLMEELGAVLELHSGPAVLEAAARSFLSLCREESAGCSIPRAARDSLVQRWVDQLTTLLEDSLKDGVFTADEEKNGEIVSMLQKLRAFNNCHDLVQWNLFELLSPLLSVESSQGGAPSEALLEVLQCLCYSLLWSLNTSSETLTSRENAVAQRLQLRLYCDRCHHCLSHSDPRVRQQAFLGVCDVLTAHSYQLKVWDPTSYGPLLYTPSPKLQRALMSFIRAHVFIGSDSDSQSGVSESSQAERLEEIHKRRNLLAAYCKLVVHGVLEMSMAAEVFMFYMKFYNDFGDIIKETICRTRQMDKMESARTLVLCLQQMFTRLKREQERGSRSRPGIQTFTSIKELARRFALTFGDPVKFRECVVMIHRNGIEFVFQEFSQSPETPTPPSLSYLTLLSEFSSKLLKPDKKTVLSYLQKHTAEHIVNLREECWQPLIYYRASLLAVAEGEDVASYVSSDRKQHTPNRSPRSKQKQEGGRSPHPLSPADTKVGKVPRLSFSPSRQEKTADLDPSTVPVEPPAQRLNMAASVLSSSNDGDDDIVEIEL